MALEKSAITFSIRTRMTVLMTVLLLLALATLYYQNQRAQREVQQELDSQKASVKEMVERQFQDINAASNVGISSLNDDVFLYNSIDDKYRGAFDRNRIRHILTVFEDGVVEDATEKELVGKLLPLPALGDDSSRSRTLHERGDIVASLDGHKDVLSDTYGFPVKTTSGFRWIIIVVSTEQVSDTIESSQERLASLLQRTSQERLHATVGVFGLAVVLMIILVWRFTRPIRRLSDAAERVAAGDLGFTVGIKRRDEIGQLSRTFDDMIGGLKAKAELEERLNNAERAAVIGRLTGAIAHEIRNPLNYINLSIDHVRSKFAPDDGRDRERFDGLLGSIKDELARLNRLVTDVLNFGRPANLQFRKVDLQEILAQVLDLVRAQAEEQGVEISAHLGSEPAEAEAEPERLKSCFSNIVINAIQAMPGGGRLDVSVERGAGTYHLRFEDTGPGIPEEALDRVFEPYYSTKDTGTGLGLAVTKKIVDEHGGHIRASSVVGRGTTFLIDLPVRRAGSAERGTEGRALASAGSGPRPVNHKNDG